MDQCLTTLEKHVDNFNLESDEIIKNLKSDIDKSND